MKEKHIRLAASLDEIVTVASAYAKEHLEKLMDRVCREDIAILVKRDHNGSVILVPYWWYHLCFGLNPKLISADFAGDRKGSRSMQRKVII